MKEHEGQPEQSELTRNTNNPRLEPGDIFMAQEGNGATGPDEPGSTEPQSTTSENPLGVSDRKKQARQAARSFRAALGGREPNADERQALRVLDDAGGQDFDDNQERPAPLKAEGAETAIGSGDIAESISSRKEMFSFEGILGKEGNEAYKAMYDVLPTNLKLLARNLAQNMYQSGAEISEEGALYYGLQNARDEKIAALNQQILQRIAGGERDGNKEQIEETRKKLREIETKITKGESLGEIREALAEFIKYAKATQPLDPEKFEKEYREKIELLESLSQQGKLAQLKEVFTGFSKEIKSNYATAEIEAEQIPDSLEDLLVFIMKTESQEWKTGGDTELIDDEGKIVKEHFMAWVRKKMMDLHDFNPTTTADFFSGIAVKRGFTQISFYEMVLTGSYFLEKRKEQVIVAIDKDGNPKTETRTTYHKNEDYEKLRLEALMEAFLFQTSRNAHVEYVANQSSESEVSKLLLKLYSTNVFTRSNHLERIMSMPSTIKKTKEEIEALQGKTGKEILTKSENNFEVGQAVRRLLLSYYYIYDLETLQNILGPKAMLFQKEYRNIDSSTGKDALNEDGTLKKGKVSEGKKPSAGSYNINAWHDSNGRFIAEGKAREEFMEYINVFTGPGPQKDETIIDEVRERMVQSIMDKEGLSYSEAKYAEAWAFSMTRWSGLAGKNDVNAVGHDSWAKVQNTQEYRFRQMADERSAIYGNPFNLMGIKRLGLNWFEGITDTEGRTILEAIQGGEGSRMDLNTAIKLKQKQSNGEIKAIAFNLDSMRNFSANHITNTFFLLEFLVEHNGFNFQDLVTIDIHGRPVIDYEKANKVIDQAEKAIRYAYSTWGGTDYSKTVSTFEIGKQEYTDEYGVKQTDDFHVVAKDLPILAQLFGPEIIKLLKEQALKQKAIKGKQHDNYLKQMTPKNRERYFKKQKEIAESGGKPDKIWDFGGELGEVNVTDIQKTIRRTLWKGVLNYLTRAEIESHRNIYSDQERFNYLKMEALYAFLKRKRVFTKDEINDIRKETHSTEFGMLLEESGGSFLAGLMQALKVARSKSAQLVQ